MPREHPKNQISWSTHLLLEGPLESLDNHAVRGELSSHSLSNQPLYLHLGCFLNSWCLVTGDAVDPVEPAVKGLPGERQGSVSEKI